MNKPKTAALQPIGETVDQRIRSMMSDKRYLDPRDQRLRNHVAEQFKKAYPGKVEYDATGKMKTPSAVIRPEEVDAFDPDGELLAQARPTSLMQASSSSPAKMA